MDTFQLIQYEFLKVCFQEKKKRCFLYFVKTISAKFYKGLDPVAEALASQLRKTSSCYIHGGQEGRVFVIMIFPSEISLFRSQVTYYRINFGVNNLLKGEIRKVKELIL